MMRDLRRRIDRLEMRLTDGSRLAPESPEWFAFWNDLMERSEKGEEVDLPGAIPWQIIVARVCARMSDDDRRL